MSALSKGWGSLRGRSSSCATTLASRLTPDFRNVMKTEGWCTEGGGPERLDVGRQCGLTPVEQGPRVEESAGLVAWEFVSV